MNKLLGEIKSSWLHKPILVVVGLMLLLLAFWPAGMVVAEPVIPQPTRELYILDEANVLSPDTEAMIISTSEELNQKTKAQVAVVTLNSLNGESLEDTSLGILRQWQLGDKELNNGLLILVVPSERKSRIEVGYGLEGALPDAKTGRIQDETMLPAFREGKYDLGIRQGYQTIVQEVAQEYNVKINAPTNNIPPAEAADKTPTWLKILGVLGLLFLLWLDFKLFNGFFFGFLLGTLFRGGGGFGGGRGGNSGGGGSGGGGGSSRGW
ncbi:MAG: TPM domain-containing protein [Syntrophomonadaceae bacterium]|jgi:uncharacterized protein